jgi:NodT family efflux transporter outer membrane factor (OMF) lipoprotein
VVKTLENTQDGAQFSMIKKHFSLLVTLFLTACAVGPDYVRPTVVVPKNYKEPGKYWKKAKPNEAVDRGHWWQVFNDPKLHGLELRLLHANQTIAVSAAKYQQALALVDEARASFFPLITLPLSANHQQQTINNKTIGINNHSYLASAAWELDLWGAIRRSVEASHANAQASQAQLAVTQLSMQATLAQLYFQLRTLDLDQKILDANVHAYQKAVIIAKNRYAAGVSARGDIIQADSLLQSAQAQAINNGVARAQFEHAIAVLIGEPASSFSFKPDPLNVLPPVIPLTVPSELLERRPDIAQAERLMAAANAQIGVAVSAYFPAVSLSASGGYQAIGFGVTSPQALGWSTGAQLLEVVFDGGARMAITRGARANYDAAVANYRQTVLAAFQNVEDNLSTLRILEAGVKVQEGAVKSARSALEIVLNQYKAGTAAFTDVIIAQTLLFNAEKNAADIAGQRMVAAVGLIKALGGGWDDTVLTS